MSLVHKQKNNSGTINQSSPTINQSIKLETSVKNIHMLLSVHLQICFVHCLVFSSRDQIPSYYYFPIIYVFIRCFYLFFVKVLSKDLLFVSNILVNKNKLTDKITPVNILKLVFVYYFFFCK